MEPVNGNDTGQQERFKPGGKVERSVNSTKDIVPAFNYERHGKVERSINSTKDIVPVFNYERRGKVRSTVISSSCIR